MKDRRTSAIKTTATGVAFATDVGSAPTV